MKFLSDPSEFQEDKFMEILNTCRKKYKAEKVMFDFIQAEPKYKNTFKFNEIKKGKEVH